MEYKVRFSSGNIILEELLEPIMTLDEFTRKDFSTNYGAYVSGKNKEYANRSILPTSDSFRCFFERKKSINHEDIVIKHGIAYPWYYDTDEYNDLTNTLKNMIRDKQIDHNFVNRLFEAFKMDTKDITSKFIVNENVIRAERYAVKCHEDVNHLYDGKPYHVHLSLAHEYALKYIELIEEKYRDVVLCAVWLHDVIEDTRKSYNDVKNEFGYEVAEIVYALTNEKGKTRKERANEKYYQGIKEIHDGLAVFVKLCDRLANVQYSFDIDSTMFGKYKDEYHNFNISLYDGNFDSMWDELKTISHACKHQ